MKKVSIGTLCIICTVGCICIMFALVGCKHGKIEVSSVHVDSTIPANNPNLKVFVENSGSMDGYMCDGSQLKDAVYDYVSDLNRYTDTTSLYYINSQIIPYNGNLTTYIKTLNPTSFHKAGGNTLNTDLGDIIANVLKEVSDTTVCIFVSDCILDLPAKDATKFLTNCEIRIKDEVINTQKRIRDLGVEILKLYSDFNGKYFYPNGSVAVLKDVKRPYYLWIFGNKNYIAKLNAYVPLSQLAKYDLSGIVAFTNKSVVPFDIFANNQTSKIAIPANGNYNLMIQADFRTTLQPDMMIQDKGNYSFNSNKITIEEIKPISDPQSKYSHFIRFKVPHDLTISQEHLSFNTPKIPSWVSEFNDESGTNIQANLNKTTGIKYLIQGVADAFKNEELSTTFDFNIKRK